MSNYGSDGRYSKSQRSQEYIRRPLAGLNSIPSVQNPIPEACYKGPHTLFGIQGQHYTDSYDLFLDVADMFKFLKQINT